MNSFMVQERQYTRHAPPDMVTSPMRRRSWAAHLGVGLITGVALGVAGRGFMRLLAEDPEFTWSGTLSIIVLFTIFGVVQGTVAAIRSRTSRRWITLPARLVGGLSYLMLGSGAGTLMAPFLWLGALALWRNTWRRWIRVALVTLAGTNLIGVVAFTLHEQGFDRLLEPAVATGFALLATTYAATVWTVGPTLQPPSPTSQPELRPLGTRRGALFAALQAWRTRLMVRSLRSAQRFRR